MEKTKNIIITILGVATIILLGLVFLLITGRIELDTEKKDNKEEIKDKIVDNEIIYSDVLIEYKNAINDTDMKESVEVVTKEYPLVNANIIYLHHNYDEEASITYTFYDINKDSNDELIVIQGQNNIIDVFSHNKEDVYKVLDEPELGYNKMLTINDDGTLVVSTSTDTKKGKVTLYKINDECKGEIIDSYYFETEGNEKKVYKYVQKKVELTDKESSKFNSIISEKSSMTFKTENLPIKKI